MRKLIVFLALMVIPARLPAFSTQDALGLVAMPLAVAAVSDVPAVPQDQLADIVATLNQADVPPVQFVEVVRYIPVTYGQTASGPTFAEFVRTETSNGVTGPALVTSITRVTLPLTVIVTVVSPTCAAIIASTQDDNDESPVVKGS